MILSIKNISIIATGLTLLTLLSCSTEKHLEADLPVTEETLFRLAKSAYSGIESKSANPGSTTAETADGIYDQLHHYITDREGNVIRNLKTHYDSAAGAIKAEGLHEGDYRLIVLGITGHFRADSIKIHEISHADETWIEFPETLRKPLEADYYYSQTPFSIKTTYGEDGKKQEVADIPETIIQKRIITRIDFDFNYRNQAVANSVVRMTAHLDAPKFYTGLSGNGQYSGSTDGKLVTIDLGAEDRCRFMPTLSGTAFRGEISMGTVNYMDENILQTYEFEITATEKNKIQQILTEVKHPDDRLATMYVTERAMGLGEFSLILQDDEPVSVYTDRSQRSFNTAEPLQASFTEDGRLHIRFYSPRSLSGALIKAKIPSVNEEYFDVAYFSHIPPFADFYDIFPPAWKDMIVRTESGDYVEIQKLGTEQLQTAEFKIESGDEYWAKIRQIKHGWNLYWGLYGGNPEKEDGGPVGNWMGIRPVHCRESVAFFLNFTFMIDMPEHEQILRDNADKLYDDNGLPVKVEEVLAKMRRNQTLQVGLVYPGNGVLGLGSPSVFGAYQRGWFEHYFNTYACSVMFHELGHVMGYGHASSFTYGPWAEQLMNNFYVQNIDVMPINSRDYLFSESNPTKYN